MEQIQIYHPDLKETADQPATVSREEYDAVWFEKGWRLWPPKTEAKKPKSASD